MQVHNQLQESGLLCAVAIARGVVVGQTSDKFNACITDLLQKRKAEEFPPPAVKQAVRSLLKTGGFKASGRNKPASEYLAQAAREGRFPCINNLVDINNYMSLLSGFPISLLDADVVGDGLLLRCGREGERYIFNSAGQEIDLEGLICSCSAATDTPLGNPVKDSVAGKIKDNSKNVVAVIYAPNTVDRSTVESLLDLFAELLSSEGHAKQIESIIV